MVAHRVGATAVSVALLLTLSLVTACGGDDLEGRYYNAVTGQFALELKDGKATGQGMEGQSLTYRVRGDTVFIEGGGMITEGLYFLRLPNGDLNVADIGTLTKDRPD